MYVNYAIVLLALKHHNSLFIEGMGLLHFSLLGPESWHPSVGSASLFMYRLLNAHDSPS